MQYRRAQIKGGTYFFTVVTYNRRKFLCQPSSIERLRASIGTVMKTYPFKIDAIVILPDHIHCIWTLPAGDHDFSTRWRLIKSRFTQAIKANFNEIVSPSRRQKQEQAVWQRRFWEHLIRDERDFNHHIDYIHFNPVKHGLVKAPKDWRYSSFYRYVQAGWYDEDWGSE